MSVITKILTNKEMAIVAYSAIQADNQVRGRKKPLEPFHKLDKVSQKYYLDMVNFLSGNPKMSYRDLYEEWYHGMLRQGWVQGKLCHKSRTHPDVKPYSKVPHGIRLTQELFYGVVQAYLRVQSEAE